MIKIAVFSDVHGNLPALKTVLNDIAEREVDQVYCLGDLVDFAPWSNEVIELIRKHKIPCLMGNHDERIAFDLDVIPLAKHSAVETAARIEAIDHTKKTLTLVNKAYLASLPHQIKLCFGTKEISNLLLVHGSTKSNDEYIYEDHDVIDALQMLKDSDADVLVMGHTHLPYVRTLATDNSKALLVNCGSVGRPRTTDRLASYALFTVESGQITAELIKLSYPVDKTINAIRRSGIPDFYADFLT